MSTHANGPCQPLACGRSQGAQSCAHWLSWRIGLDSATAREKVRVARALGQLPLLDAALAAGRISYAKVRAITRVATPGTEGRLVEMAACATGAQLERICRRYRGLRGQFMREEAERTGELAGDGADTERMIYLRNLPSGMVRLEATLQPDEADLVMKAIDKARDELRALSLGRAKSLDPGRVEGDGASAEMPAVVASVDAGSTVAAEAGKQRAVASGARGAGPAASNLRLPLPGRADALLFLAEASLEGSSAGSGRPRGPGIVEGGSAESRYPGLGGDRYRILIHLSESLVGPDGQWEAFLEDGTLLSAEAFRRASCDGGLVPAVVTNPATSASSEADGVVTGNVGVNVDVGRQSRAIPAALRRALWLRDDGCRFPGCGNRRFIHGHHIRHWANGGDLAAEPGLAVLVPPSARARGLLPGAARSGIRRARVVRSPGPTHP